MSQTTNLVRNPQAASTTDWSVAAATGSPAFIASTGAVNPSGTNQFVRATLAAASATVDILNGGAGVNLVTAGSQYTFSMYALGTTAGSVNATARVQWFDASNAAISTSSGSAILLSGWTRATVTANAPALAVRGLVSVRYSAVVGNLAIADLLYATAAQLETGATASPFITPGVGLAFWNGTPNASTSTLYVPVVTITPLTDANPCPRAQVAISDIPSSSATVNLTRTAEGRQFMVRGGVALFSGGSIQVMDYEVPFGVPVNYQAQMFDSSGNSLGNTPTGTVTVAVTDSWMHQPLSPTLAIMVRVFNTTSTGVTRVAPGDLVYPEGASVGTWVGGQRQGIQNLQLGFRVNSGADADEFQSMFGSYSTDFPAVICLRTPPPVRLPRTLFFASSGPVETAQANFTYITYHMSVNEASPPTPGLIIPLLRREDMDAAYPTRAALDAAYPTRLARDNDFSKAGLAGP